MEEQLISLKTARLAKEKGFNEVCLNFYGQNPVFNDFTLFTCKSNYKDHKNSNNPISISAPTQSLLQKWLREKHNLHVYLDIVNFGNDEYNWNLYDLYEEKNIEEGFVGGGGSYTGVYSTYEEALEKGLQEALKLIK